MVVTAWRIGAKLTFLMSPSARLIMAFLKLSVILNVLDVQQYPSLCWCGEKGVPWDKFHELQGIVGAENAVTGAESTLGRLDTVVWGREQLSGTRNGFSCAATGLCYAVGYPTRTYTYAHTRTPIHLACSTESRAHYPE